jgi:hypothetical protein
MNLLSILILIASGISILSLLLLHITSPEYKPSWRMISEYANGKFKILITVFFIFWGLSTILTAIIISQNANGIWMNIGISLVILSGLGAIFGGLFDINHKLHGMSFALGVPTLPIGALMLHSQLQNSSGEYSNLLFYSTHSIWISLILMGISMGLLISGFKKSGLPMGPDVKPPEKLPEGVIGINGYFNRLLVVCYIGWVMLIAFIFI